MFLSCTIIDDEPLAVRLLESYVSKTPFLKLRSTYSSAVEAMEGLTENPVDLLFLDIQMPGLNGLEFAKIVDTHTRIVFTTAFSSYAVEGYKVNAIDYLMKPFGYADFLAAAQKALVYFEAVGRHSAEAALHSAEATPHSAAADHSPAPSDTGVSTADAESFFVKSDYRIVRLSYRSILYVEGLKDYVKIYTEGDSRATVALTSMTRMADFLPGNFIRIHRSFIVNMDHVNIIDRGQIVIAGRNINIGDSYKDAVSEYVGRRMLQGR